MQGVTASPGRPLVVAGLVAVHVVEAVLLFVTYFIALLGVFELRQEAVSWVGLTGQSWWTYPGGYLVEGALIVAPLLLSVPVLAGAVFLTSRLWPLVVSRRNIAYVWTAVGGGGVSLISAGAAFAVGSLG